MSHYSAFTQSTVPFKIFERIFKKRCKKPTAPISQTQSPFTNPERCPPPLIKRVIISPAPLPIYTNPANNKGDN